ncbi:hypothetical protein J6590_046849, partial [Homalodisca vitripennis]
YTTNSKTDEYENKCNNGVPSISGSEESDLENVTTPSPRPTSKPDSASKRKISGTPLADEHWKDVGLGNVIVNMEILS